jgi:hypothetical protein
VLGGELFRSDLRGNPSPDIEGFLPFSGGILDVVRNDVPGGLFTFQWSQIAEFSFRPSRPVLPLDLQRLQAVLRRRPVDPVQRGISRRSTSYV